MGGGLLLSRPFSLFDRLETELNLNYLHRQYSDNTQQTSRVTSVRLSLIHDDTMWYDFEPANGTRNNFSLVWADQLLGGQVNYSLIQLDSQLYQSLDMISPYLVFGARLLGAASLGPDHPLFIFGGIGVLAESGTIRGYSYGELLGSQILALNLELRFPLARNINYTLWPIDFLLLKDVQAVVFNDVGVVSQNFMDTTPHDVRDSVGLGFRLHTFLLGKQLMTIRFDMAKRTNGYSDLIYTWGIGQAF
jgi:outer membrane protein assembly factor BamA